MCHLPRWKTWDTQLLAEALRKRGVKATRDADRVELILLVERFDTDRIVNAKSIDDLRPELVGFTHATISFASSAVVQKIVFECERYFEVDCYPRTTDVTDAIVDCGYDTGSNRDLANRYYTGEIDFNPIFDRIEELQIKKENAVAENRYPDAKAILEKQRPLKQQIEDLLRPFI